jgi:hypothetical protein
MLPRAFSRSTQYVASMVPFVVACSGNLNSPSNISDGGVLVISYGGAASHSGGKSGTGFRGGLRSTTIDAKALTQNNGGANATTSDRSEIGSDGTSSIRQTQAGDEVDKR